MSARVHIAVSFKDRFPIVRECLPTIAAGMWQDDSFWTYDDGSDGAFSGRFYGATRQLSRNESIGIDAQRRNHFLHFMETDATHLYLTDADALHDVEWRNVALRLQGSLGGVPICLYNTAVHANLVGNTLLDDPAEEVVWRYYAPGISYFLTRAHADKFCAVLPTLPAAFNWDWTLPTILGNRIAVTRMSYVDHIGHGGIHHPEGAGWDAGDRATNPTPWLVERRALVEKKLSAASML